MLLKTIKDRSISDEMIVKQTLRFSMTLNRLKMQTMNHLIENASERWKSFMSSKDDWMFNFYTDDDGPISTRWARLNALKAAIVKKGNTRVQIKRSATEVALQASDVFSTRNAFSNFQRQTILEENFKHDTMAELETAVLEMTKKYIVENIKIISKTEGPWKAFHTQQ